MDQQRLWLWVLACAISGLLVLGSEGCGPTQRPTPGTEGTPGQEQGNEQAKTEAPTEQEQVKPNEAVAKEKPPTPRETRPEKPTPEQPTTDAGQPEKQQPPERATPPEPAAPDTTGKEAPPKEAQPTECEQKGGHCVGPNGTCKAGYQMMNNTFGCQSNCCLPKPPPTCGKEGETISLNEQCCAGLTKGGVGTPPNCVSTGQKFVCVKCGDGKCDATKGENECSCPTDCKSASTDCAQNKGRCVNSRLGCRPTETIDKKLTCSSLALVCCISKSTPQCKSHCDCTQGMMCASGVCVSPTKPVYCCSNAGCPTGQACTDAAGKAGTCGGTTTTPCAKAGGYCAVQFTNCKTGYKQDNTYSCNARALNCCMPAKNKCATVKCQPPSCKMNFGVVCQETTYTCDPATGKCVAATKSVTGGKCGSNGLCATTTPQCKTNCDCTQGLLCTGGKCIAGFAPAYCCDKAGCPTGQTCTDSAGNKGICK